MEERKLKSLLKFYKKHNVKVELIIKTRGGIVIRGQIIKLNKLLKRYIIIKSLDNSPIKIFLEDIVYDTLIPINFIIESKKNKKNKKERDNISSKLRFDVFRRDKYVCQYCGACGPGVELEVDHVIPVSKGGTDNIDNLKTSCFNCNRGKGDNLKE